MYYAYFIHICVYSLLWCIDPHRLCLSVENSRQTITHRSFIEYVLRDCYQIDQSLREKIVKKFSFSHYKNNCHEKKNLHVFIIWYKEKNQVDNVISTGKTVG